jgi:hypothetical protein
VVKAKIRPSHLDKDALDLLDDPDPATAAPRRGGEPVEEIAIFLKTFRKQGFLKSKIFNKHVYVGLAALRPISLRVSFQNLDRDLGELV